MMKNARRDKKPMTRVAKCKNACKCGYCLYFVVSHMEYNLKARKAWPTIFKI
jgi:hypothetical protein